MAKYQLYTNGDGAWAESGDLDKRIVEAMKNGKTMSVSGVSWRGTQTSDRYSLSGVTAAMNKIDSMCKLIPHLPDASSSTAATTSTRHVPAQCGIDPLVMTATIEIDRRGSTGSGKRASKKWIIGLTRAQLQSELEAIGVPERQSRMRASQLWQWLYNRGATSFDEMTNISKDLRARFEEHFRISRLDIVTEQISSDGTRKWLLRLPPDELGRRHEVETVYIPEEDRGTLCISSQVGCTLTCTFCHTGTQTLVRNLTPERLPDR
jgi:hypothetical protein